MLHTNRVCDRKSLTKTERALLLGYQDGMEACHMNPARGSNTTRMGRIGTPAEFDTAPCRGAMKRGWEQAQIDFKYLNDAVAEQRGKAK